MAPPLEKLRILLVEDDPIIGLDLRGAANANVPLPSACVR